MSRLAYAALAAATWSACYGPHSITYIDSAREAGDETYEHDLGPEQQSRVDLSRCPSGEVARIETSSSWADMLVSYLTLSSPARSAEITCVKR